MEHENTPKWDDYTPLASVGEGAYGSVTLCRCKKTQELVAIKKVEQALLVRVAKVGAALREKAILAELSDNPFAICLKTTFKDGANLYFVFEHCPFGTIGDLAATFPDQRLPEQIAAFYTAELILLLEHIHS